MKIFSIPALRQPLTRSQAWACAALNQFAFPGLGTVFARRRAGYFQAAVMIAAFALLTGYMLWYIFCVARFMMHPTGDADALRAQYQPYAWAWKSGLALLLAAWSWALGSSIGIVREASRTG